MTKPLPIPPQQSFFETTERYNLSTKGALLEARLYRVLEVAWDSRPASLERISALEKCKLDLPASTIASRLARDAGLSSLSHDAVLEALNFDEMWPLEGNGTAYDLALAFSRVATHGPDPNQFRPSQIQRFTEAHQAALADATARLIRTHPKTCPTCSRMVVTRKGGN